jgi:cytochrome c biogenesis protein CcmG, thiol:disulfide interchange protein DsbE
MSDPAVVPPSASPATPGPQPRGRRRHLIRWVAGAVLAVLAAVGIVLATRTPQEATAVQSPLLGHQAPLFSGTDLVNGSNVDLAGLRGHYVVINFFASWCGPCQTEAPDLSRFAYQQAHTSDGADMVSVVFHDTNSTARQFLVANGDLWPALGDPDGAIANRYGVTSPPTTFVVSPSGRVTAVLEGPATTANLDAFLKAARNEQSGANA